MILLENLQNFNYFDVKRENSNLYKQSGFELGSKKTDTELTHRLGKTRRKKVGTQIPHLRYITMKGHIAY
jgi:hypothetical protein